MSIESDLFYKLKPDYNKLLDYGFQKIEDNYVYRKLFFDDEFEATIIVSDSVNGHIYDCFSNEEYINFRLGQGEFASKIRGEYILILEDIAKKCFTYTNFISSQGRDIEDYILNKYHKEPEFLWKSQNIKETAVFRHDDKKWFGIIMNISAAKFNLEDKKVEVLNLKVNDVSSYININGIYEAYHMSKKNWISIILDNTLSNEEIFKLIDLSYNNTLKIVSKNWITPCNASFFDIEDYFNSPLVEWKQTTKIKENDIVYIYVSKPYSCIMYKCLVRDVNLDNNYFDNDKVKIMILQPLIKYPRGKWSFDRIKNLGMKAIRGPRSMSVELLKEMEKEDD